MNIQDLLKDLVPAKVRLWVYLIVALLLIALTIWQASDGNWLVALTSFLGALSSAGLSAPNTTTAPPEPLTPEPQYFRSPVTPVTSAVPENATQQPIPPQVQP